MSTVDTHWTFFQAPLIIEDALGLKFSVPSEYDYSTLDVLIRHRFRDGTGSREVSVGNYELFRTKRRGEIIEPNARLLPGTEITMAVILGTSTPIEETCPMPRCNSANISAYPGGGLIW